MARDDYKQRLREQHTDTFGIEEEEQFVLSQGPA